MSEVVFSEEDLEYLIKGACFLGSGGGGPLDLARDIKEEILKGPKRVEMVDLEKVLEDDMICVVAGVGAPSAQARFSDSPLHSFELLEKEVRQKFQYVIPLETGAVNSLIPLLVAARSKVPVRLVNADGGGRSFPQIQMSTFALKSISCNPAVVVVEDRIFHTGKPQEMEDQIRKGTGPSTLATFSMSGRDLKATECCVPKALQNAIDVGKALKLHPHEARIKQIGKILDRTVTSLMLEGTFKDLQQIKDPSFDVGTVTLSGESRWGSEIQICFVNENIAVRVGNKPIAMAPGMLCYLTTEGMPFTNAEVMKDWNTWKNVPVTLTLIDPAKEIAGGDEIRFFQDIYDTYFLKKRR